MKKLLVLAVTTALTLPAFAQKMDTALLSRYLDTLAANNRFMGSVALSRNGTVIYKKAVGFADQKTLAPNTPQTLFRIGSISKSFTAALILKAAEEGKLKLSDPLSKYFPKLKVVSDATIEQTLYHRSGIHNLTADTVYLSYRERPQNQAAMLQIIEKGGRDFPADSAFSYSNSGYVLLSYILEKVYKQPFDKVLEEKICKPLKLTNTGVHATGHNQNSSYSWNSKWVPERNTDLSITMGAGNILSTPSDLVRFYEALLTGKIVSNASLSKMKAMKDNFGMGLISFPYNQDKAYGHTGGIDGYQSIAGYFPDSKLGMAIVGNGMNYLMNDIAIAMLNTVHNVPITVPDFTKKSSSSQSVGYPGVYSSSVMPMKVTVTQEGDKLTMQASGQSAFPLERVEKDKYQFTPAGIQVEFFPEEKAFIMKQGGAEFRFIKD